MTSMPCRHDHVTEHYDILIIVSYALELCAINQHLTRTKSFMHEKIMGMKFSGMKMKFSGMKWNF